MAGDILGTGQPDGTNIGRSDDLMGFYGLAAPIAKPSLALTATALATANTASSAIVVDLLAIKAVLVNLGMVTSA